jgi:AcrR family transcriptional regulator
MDYAIIDLMSTSSELQTDGRIKRSERSRTAIVQAMLELIGEGSLSPTAQQVAERADVGVRTVFRHFSDMETLFATMNEKLTADVDSLFVESVQTGSFEERVEALIERRSAIFSALAPYVRSSTLQRWRSAFLQSEHERSIRVMRRDLRRWLPEIESSRSEIADGVEMILSFEAWNRLRIDQRLSLRRTAVVLRQAVLDLTKTIRPTA